MKNVQILKRLNDCFMEDLFLLTNPFSQSGDGSKIRGFGLRKAFADVTVFHTFDDRRFDRF